MRPALIDATHTSNGEGPGAGNVHIGGVAFSSEERKKSDPVTMAVQPSESWVAGLEDYTPTVSCCT